MKQHYWQNRNYYLDKARRRHRNEVERVKKLVRGLKEIPCADCGRQYPYWVMEFDHVTDDKVFSIGARMHGSLRQLLEEIAKCEVVCSNCHRTRTYHRMTRARSSVD